jgi:hypothetical protein
MKRDDFNVRIDQVRELATKYSKPELQRMVQMGVVGPQEAVMAGMMIDRIAKSAMTPPQTTVAQDVLGAAPTAEGQGMPPQMPQGQMPQGQMPPPPQMAAAGGIMGALPYSDGVASLPTNLPDYAGGGIVAFADGGPSYLPDNIDYSKGKIPIYTSKAPEQVDLVKAAGMRTESERQAGFDPNMYKGLRDEELAGKQDLAKQREEAKGMAALQFGIGLMGAREGQEFQTASESGKQALAQYGNTIKDIRTSEKEMKKSLRELTMAENAYKKSNADKDLARVEDSKSKVQAHEDNIANLQNNAVKLGQDLFKTTETNAMHKLIADQKNLSDEKIAKLNILARQAELNKPGEMERINKEYERRLKTEGQEAADAYKARMLQFKGIEARAGVTDDDLQKTYFKQIEGMFGNEKKEFLKRFPTYKEFIEYQRTRAAQGGGSAQPSGQVDTRNPLLAG